MSLPLITIAQMREWEQLTWAVGESQENVMRRAGLAVARAALARTQPGQHIVVLAGKGNNGGDARYAAEQLTERSVQIIEIKDPTRDIEAVGAALQKRPALVVDGLFGIGLNRPLDPPWIKLIQSINQARLPVLAVDVPSGLNADTGEIMGAAIEAVETVTFAAVKKGFLNTAASSCLGRVTLAPDIGLIPCPSDGECQWTMPEDFERFPPPRPPSGHKGTFGHLVIIGGSLGYHGASVLATRGAQRAQPGLITLYTSEQVYQPVASQLQAVMVQPLTSSFDLPESCTGVLVGPGLASKNLPSNFRTAIGRLWLDEEIPIVADASALDWLPSGPQRHFTIRCLTPHPGEAARLLQMQPKQVQADRPAALQELSRSWGNCWVVLKGQHSLVGQSGSPIYVNPTGNPQLAQGGSGDLLGGFIAGLLAQPPLQEMPGLAIRYAVWNHGASADWLSRHQPNWVVEDLATRLGLR